MINTSERKFISTRDLYLIIGSGLDIDASNEGQTGKRDDCEACAELQKFIYNREEYYSKLGDWLGHVQENKVSWDLAMQIINDLMFGNGPEITYITIDLETLVEATIDLTSLMNNSMPV